MRKYPVASRLRSALNAVMARLGRKKRNMKDQLFQYIFSRNPQALLELYNALNDTDYSDVTQMEYVTLGNAVYITMKNDLAFLLSGTINLYEHQSTLNPNIPLRLLIYLTEEYQVYASKQKKSIYGSTRILLPIPQCVVFYNGKSPAPEEAVLHLSDAFSNKTIAPSLEFNVRMININAGYNQKLMNACRMLSDYSRFIQICRDFCGKIADRDLALENAIEYCIENDILKEILETSRAEVLGMLLYDFDEEKFKKTLKEEGREEGVVRERIRMFTVKLRKGKSYEQILGELELADSPENTSLYGIALKNAPDYEEEAIFSEYMASANRKL